jgi:hypothetical protein
MMSRRTDMLIDILNQVRGMNPGANTALVVPDLFEQKIIIDSIGELVHDKACCLHNTITFNGGKQSLHVVTAESDSPLYDVAWIAANADIQKSIARVEIYLED